MGKKRRKGIDKKIIERGNNARERKREGVIEM